MTLQGRGLAGIFASFPVLPVMLLITSIGGTAQIPDFDTNDNQPKLAAQGYVTSVDPPNGFTVNGTIEVTTSASTTYKFFSSKDGNGAAAANDELQVGAFVRVTGPKKKKAVSADLVELRQLQEEAIKGFAVIDKVIEAGPEPVLAADGYRIRVTAATEVRYPEDVKSPADVQAGMWLLYEGKLNEAGLLVASKARFLEHRHAKGKSGAAPGDTSQLAANGSSAAKDNALPPKNAIDQPEITTANGKTTIKLDPTNKYSTDDVYKVSPDQALQVRVGRVGMSLVPNYQKQLPADDPSKFQFHFYAIDEPELEMHSSTDGLVLVPAQLATRFKSDDQLAALLADGVANVLQHRAPIVIQVSRASLARGAVLAAADLNPYTGMAAGSVFTYENDKELQEQRSRVALALMAEAGYDPWQAPETWRLAAPWKLPADTSKLKYPERSGYQLSILNLMYRKSEAAPAQ